MHIKFAVGERAYCLWGRDVARQNLEFLESLDPSFFLHAAEVHLSSLNEDADTERASQAALGLRLFYGHALESLLALLSAALQAPDAVVGWMCQYREPQLKHVLQCLSSGRHTYAKIRLEEPTWRGLSDVIHSCITLSDLDKLERIKGEYADFWSRAAHTHMNERAHWEYNSIKHGLRARSGGYTLRIREEKALGVPDPDAPVHTVAASKFGSSFFVPEAVAVDSRHIALKHWSVNWQPQALVNGIEIATMSLKNVIGFLRVVNGVDPRTISFSWPADLGVLTRAWHGTPGLESFAMGPVIDRSELTPLTKQEILEVYEQFGEDDA